MVEVKAAKARAPGHRVRSLAPGAAVAADLQVGLDRALGQAQFFAVDPGRDGLTEPVAMHDH